MEFVLWQLEVHFLTCPKHIGIHRRMAVESLDLFAHRNLAGDPARTVTAVGRQLSYVGGSLRFLASALGCYV